MEKHTPPPWRTNKLKDGNVELVKDDGSVMATFYGDDNDPICWPVSANAQLAATAPELYEALRNIVLDIQCEGRHVEVIGRYISGGFWDRAVAALAKARVTP